MDIVKFKKSPILGILRGIKPDAIAPLIEEAILPSGLAALEITMNTEGAADIIRKAVKASGGKVTIGAGTVLGLEDLKAALDAGATFIVMPALIRDVVDHCVKNKIPSFPGALTPQEIYDAWNAGAAMVKVFPSGFFGPKYFGEIKGPFRDIELLACGGVTADNIKDYFAHGADAVAFGASIFRKDLLEKKDFASVRDAIKKLIRSK